MPDDPLIRALECSHLLTPGDVMMAIRYREAKIEDLQAEIRSLRCLLEAWDEAAAVRAERDPPEGLP